MYSGIIHVEKAEKAGARVLPDAVVYRIEVDAKERISAVHYKDPEGVTHRVTGKYFANKKQKTTTPISYHEAAAELLWNESARLTHLEEA